MDIGSYRPTAVGAAQPVARAPGAAEVTVRTELPQRAVVAGVSFAEEMRLRSDTGADRGPAAPMQGARRESGKRQLERKIERDEDTGTLVYKTVDEASGAVISQVPEEIMLRLKIMVRAWTEGALGDDLRPGGLDIKA